MKQILRREGTLVIGKVKATLKVLRRRLKSRRRRKKRKLRRIWIHHPSLQSLG
jgi:hypothetical protein